MAIYVAEKAIKQRGQFLILILVQSSILTLPEMTLYRVFSYDRSIETIFEFLRNLTMTSAFVYCIYSQRTKVSYHHEFTHYISGNYCRNNLLELKNNIEVYKYHNGPLMEID